ncbi:MAG TPA: DUF6458 family protein [Actinomycetota bacterium]|jgi:hypothetical protein|nr:DUF6458 family protein [Actinomycetota bacterium]
MSLGASIFLIVIGAILAFAVHVSTSGFDVNTVGVILMAAGLVGLVLTLVLSSGSRYRRRRSVVGPDTIVEERPVIRERRVERDVDVPPSDIP